MTKEAYSTAKIILKSGQCTFLLMQTTVLGTSQYLNLHNIHLLPQFAIFLMCSRLFLVLPP